MNLLKKATDDTTRLITMGSNALSVDKQGYVLKDGVPYLITTDAKTPGKPGLVVQDPLPVGDYFLINPYGEMGGVHSTPLNFFYRIMLSGMVFSLIGATTNVLILLIKASKKEITTAPPEVLKVASLNKIGDAGMADVIDARMVKEFEKIDALVAGNIHLIYPPKKMRVSLHLENLDVETLQTNLGSKVRVKTIQVYRAILFGILGISDESGLDKFTTVYDPDVKAPPKMWCFLNSLLKVYLAISGLLDDVGLFPKGLDLAELAAIIERIPEVFQQSRHVIKVEYGANDAQPTVKQASPAAPQTQASAAPPKQSFRDRLFGDGQQVQGLGPAQPAMQYSPTPARRGIQDDYSRGLTITDTFSRNAYDPGPVGGSGGGARTPFSFDPSPLSAPLRPLNDRPYSRTIERGFSDRRF